MAVTKPNNLLANFLSKRDNDKFSLNCFCNFQTDEKIKQHQKSCKKNNHIELEIREKFKTVLHNENDKK